MFNNGKKNLEKFDSKSHKGIFLGYSFIGKAYKIFIRRTLLVEELVHVVFDESIFPSITSQLVDKDALMPKIDNLGLKENEDVREELPRELRYASSYL